MYVLLFKSRDEKLAGRVMEGDTAALETIYNEYYDAIYNFIYYRVKRDIHTAEDITQNVFFAMISQIENFNPEKGGFYGWLCGIARHLVIKHLRLVKSRPTMTISETSGDGNGEFGWVELLDQSPLPDAVLESNEVKSCVASVLAKLPDNYRFVLQDKYMEGLSVQAMAQCRKVTEKTVESMLSRARDAFRRLFIPLLKNNSVTMGINHEA